MKSTPVINIQQRTIEYLISLSSRLGRKQRLAPHLELGLEGQMTALFELRRRRYTVVARRSTSSRMRGDIDLIAWDGEWLCFVEVKTRSQRNSMAPAETAVDREKQRMLRRMAHAYLRNFPEESRRQIPVRFDIITVYNISQAPEFELFRGAFGWS